MDINRFQNKRVVMLNNSPINFSGDCIVYWMQRAQRVDNNPALIAAVSAANELSKPVCVYFGLDNTYPMGSMRVFKFMLEGLVEVRQQLEDIGIGLCLMPENPAEGIIEFSSQVRACSVYTDQDYLRTGRVWRSAAAQKLDISFIQVDSDTVVPVLNQQKEEWGAYTIRPKILRAMQNYLDPVPVVLPLVKWNGWMPGAELDNPEQYLSDCSFEHEVDVVPDIHGGAVAARQKLQYFLENLLPDYAENAGEIGTEGTSGLSPYLHFGQISPLEIAIAASESDVPGESMDSFMEQLVVRRELAINFCWYNTDYDSLAAAPPWALRTLRAHAQDPRPFIYSLEELEQAKTHDELWNAAQIELLKRGSIHNYMRMLWAKKILEWTPSPEAALQTAIYLNDKYALDGRDPNGYASIAWSIFGKHDRPFAERAVFGQIRYMSSKSTKRRKHWEQYLERINSI